MERRPTQVNICLCVFFPTIEKPVLYTRAVPAGQEKMMRLLLRPPPFSVGVFFFSAKLKYYTHYDAAPAPARNI
jgi:hypothetical protein